MVDKDAQRIKDIITKSKGDKKKEAQLATTMAKKIMDASKALRRASAAENVKRSDIAKIFKQRARTILGIHIKTKLKYKVSNDYDD